MRRFESIVMSETEPASQGTLWLRPKKNTLDKNGPTPFDIWYFGETGWRPIADFDTRYNFDTSYTPEPSEEGLVIGPNKNLEVGIVDNILQFSVYDGSRKIQSSRNFVLESGLKKEIDDLRDYIDNEVGKLNDKIADLSNSLDSVSSRVTSNTDRVARVEGRLSLLES